MFNNERTFGVEIEFIGNAESVKQAVCARGVNCEVEGYNKRTRGHWKIVTDGSVRRNRYQTGGGLEIVSPILKGQDGLEQLRKVCEALEAAGADVNKTCGLHIHHDAGDFNTDSFKNLVKIYVRFEPAIDTLFPRSRRANNNDYCRSMRHIDPAIIERQNDVHGIRYALNQCRYYKLNLESYVTHGTVEFRQHSGTVEYEKIANWIKLTQGMVERAVSRRVGKGKVGHWDAFKEFLGRDHMVWSYDEETKDVFKFYNKRRKELAA